MIKSDTHFSSDLKMTASLGGGFSYSSSLPIKEMTVNDIEVQNVQLSVHLIKDKDKINHHNILLSSSFNLEKIISSYVADTINDSEPDLVNVLYIRQSLIQLKTKITAELDKLKKHEDELRANL